MPDIHLVTEDVGEDDFGYVSGAQLSENLYETGCSTYFFF
jgi:hypothetical protein